MWSEYRAEIERKHKSTFHYYGKTTFIAFQSTITKKLAKSASDCANAYDKDQEFKALTMAQISYCYLQSIPETRCKY
jgi:hypothetical protein